MNRDVDFNAVAFPGRERPARLGHIVRATRRVMLGFAMLTAAIAMPAAARISMLSIGGASTPTQLGAWQDDHYDYRGVIHWHTGHYSHDANGSYGGVADVAGRLGLDFMISTEHNTLDALKDGKEGWYGKTLVLAGIEMSRPEGYLLGLDLPYSQINRSDATAAVLDKISGEHGLIFVAHPENPRWTWSAPIDPRMAGQEILDFTDQWYTAGPLRMAAALFYYPFNTPAAYMELYHYPAKTLSLWDAETRQRSFVGIYAPDMHQAIEIGSQYKLPFPKAADLLGFAADHVLTTAPLSGDLATDKAALYDAIARGHLYVAMDVLQDARGFQFTASQDGAPAAWMGDRLPAGHRTAFTVRLPQQDTLKGLVVRIFRNGDLIAQGPAGTSYAFNDDRAGAYRVEVAAHIPTFWGGTRPVVWIYSNPIYLR